LHAKQRVSHGGLGGGERAEAHEHLRLTIERCTVDGLQQSGQAGTCLPLDLNVNHDKPFLIQAPEKILQEDDVIELDRSCGVKPSPIIQRVGGVREHRWSAEPLRNLIPGLCQLRRQGSSRMIR
jgi:hypothetical protein